MIRPTAALTWALTGLLAACGPTVTPGPGPAEPKNPAPTTTAPSLPEEPPPPGPGPIGTVKPTATGAYQAPTPEQLARLVASNNQFATQLYAQLRSRSGNLTFSPASISLALSMTYAGARNETAKQMHQTLRFAGQDGDAVHGGFGALLRTWAPKQGQPYELQVANRLFGEQSLKLKAPFLATTKDHYQAPLERMDFKGAPEASRQRINAWVEEKTKEKIRNLLPEGSIDNTARLVLTNAIYFLGTWAKQFDKKRTTDESFYTPAGAEQKVKMMHQQGHYPFAQVDGLKVLTMPYKGGHFAMTILLPDARDGLKDLETKLTTSALDGWLKGTRHHQVNVALPRFTIDPPGSIALKSTLSAMGMPIAFDPAKADLLNIAGLSPPDVNFAISQVFHKAFVKVNEEGTEAAAATAVVVIGVTSAMPMGQPKVFRADHPFIFVIRDTRNGSILFLGRVESP